MAATTEAAAHGGSFVAPAFDAGGGRLAVYDSGNDRIIVFGSADLSVLHAFQPARRPRQLSFSPTGRYIVVEAHAGWIADFLAGRPGGSGADIRSPTAVRDDIQRVEVHDQETGQTVADIACDAVLESPPQGGWLWARNRAIVPGYRHAPLLAAFFAADESEFAVLCWNGVRERWDPRSWRRLPDVPPPASWSQAAGLGAAYFWDPGRGEPRRPPGDCAPLRQPVYALSGDGSRIVVACPHGMGHALRVWDLGSSAELPLQAADFGVTHGAPLIRNAGLALSNGGHYLAAAVLQLTEALVVMPLPMPVAVSRSDLRLWDVATGRELAAVPIDDLAAAADYFQGVDVAFSPDSAKLAVAGSRLRIYRMSDLGAAQQ